jgi:hypothetical protein
MEVWLSSAVIAAVVGGITASLTAYFRGRFDEKVQEKRLNFERDNARQQRLIEAQWDLLDKLGRECWDFRYDANRVIYHWKHGQTEAYEKASKVYGDKCWRHSNEIRFLSTRAGRLFNRDALEKIEAFYQRIDKVDAEIEKAIGTNDVNARSALLIKIEGEVEDGLREKIADLILTLAEEVGLTPNAKQTEKFAWLEGCAKRWTTFR